MLSWNVYVSIIFVAFSSASFANFFDDCLQDGMIFQSYGKWLKNNESFWKKPIGGCIVCTTTWITFLMIILFIYLPYLFALLSIIGISNTILKFIIK